MIRNILICLLIFISNFIITESIFGGHETTISNYPYQVSIRYDNKHHCGGSIVDDTTILTAAHCVHGSLLYLAVFLATTNVDPIQNIYPVCESTCNYCDEIVQLYYKDCSALKYYTLIFSNRDYSKYSVRLGHTSQHEGQNFQVVEIIEHQDYRETSFDKDIALLKLDFPITYNPNIQPIKLQRPSEEETPPGTISWISGWGRTDIGSYPENLRTTSVEIITNKKCSSKHGKDKITTHMMCAYTSKHDACIGDSGGPLVVDKVQIGIVSWGRGCAHLKYPGVYTKVADLYDWIQSNKNKKNYNVCPNN